VIEGGRVRSADNLGEPSSWLGLDLGGLLLEALGGEVRVANDADLAALGCAEGRGVELCVTLGSGVGTGLVVDGVLQHHLELSALPLAGSASLDAHVGEAARKLLEPSTWNARCVVVLELLDRVVRPDRLFLAGGNARRVRRSSLGQLQDRLWVTSEPVGILGGEHLYR
jgi:polyphosphate glucokinase